MKWWVVHRETTRGDTVESLSPPCQQGQGQEANCHPGGRLGERAVSRSVVVFAQGFQGAQRIGWKEALGSNS